MPFLDAFWHLYKLYRINHGARGARAPGPAPRGTPRFLNPPLKKKKKKKKERKKKGKKKRGKERRGKGKLKKKRNRDHLQRKKA